LPTNAITQVREVQEAGWRRTFPAAGYHTYNPFIDIPITAMDFGNTRLARISGVVFDDRDADGSRGAGETGLAGRSVYVDLNENGTADVGEPVAATDPGGNYAFDLARDADGRFVVRQLLPAAGWRYTLPATGARTVTVADGQEVTAVDFGNARAVAGRLVFYNASGFDGHDPAANSNDEQAIATDKSALLPGGRASFANVTSSPAGINGVMIDIAQLPGQIDKGDFAFRFGDGDDLSAWALAPTPATISVRRGAGAGGTDRVTLTWADRALRNTWLQLTVKAGADTGLPTEDVFYFGNLAGETGDSETELMVNNTDLVRSRAASGSVAAVTSRFDHRRDRRVNTLDVMAVRANMFQGLRLINPAAAAPGAAATAESSWPASTTSPVRAAVPPRRRSWYNDQPDLLGRGA
jgi:hypothetical protein